MTTTQTGSITRRRTAAAAWPPTVFSSHHGVEADYGYSLNTQKYVSTSGVTVVKTNCREISGAYVFRMPVWKITPFALVGGFVYKSPTYDLASLSGMGGVTHRAEPSIGFGYGSNYPLEGVQLKKRKIRMLRQIRSEVGILWCNLAHNFLMWPVHGQYECRSCGRRYPAFGQPLANRRMNWRVLRQAMPLVVALLLTSAARPAHAARAMKSPADIEAQAVLHRYIAAEGHSPWGAASLEIHASLPRFEETGEAMAIRRAIPIGEDRYQLLDFGGDLTVRAQLIVRYLNAEGRIAEMPLASVAITPANYRFTYKRRVDDGEREPAYVFEITPRCKRDGLIKGELWLGQQTGALIRQSGYLVKCPSVSAGRVAIIRDENIRDGTIVSRRIHIKIEGGSIDGAELVIEEHPLAPAGTAHVSAWQRPGSRP